MEVQGWTWRLHGLRRGLGKLAVVTGLLGSRWKMLKWQCCLVKTRAWKLGRGTALDRAAGWVDGRHGGGLWVSGIGFPNQGLDGAVSANWSCRWHSGHRWVLL
ncbi:hypothetical protein M0R45_006623 [Rubus argutus]|uniref:Uncharacterized protein n=1 Tax=Rubus argutus TaxID=59490 RepID=A0AAW1YR21_RUBAR